MSVDLIGYGEESFSFATWHGCLELAATFGWKSAGTIAPSGQQGPWTGTYGGNDGQQVTDKDARAMAGALRQALTALKPNSKLTAKQRKAWANKYVDVFSVFRLAAHADKGGFVIL